MNNSLSKGLGEGGHLSFCDKQSMGRVGLIGIPVCNIYMYMANPLPTTSPIEERFQEPKAARSVCFCINSNTHMPQHRTVQLATRDIDTTLHTIHGPFKCRLSTSKMHDGNTRINQSGADGCPFRIFRSLQSLGNRHPANDWETIANPSYVGKELTGLGERQGEL